MTGCEPLEHGQAAYAEKYAFAGKARHVVWAPSENAAAQQQLAEKPDKNKRYVLFRRSDKDSTAFGGVFVQIFKEKAVGCEDTIVEMIHLGIGQQRLYECDPKKVGNNGVGICYATHYEHSGVLQAPTQLSCTPPTPNETTL